MDAMILLRACGLCVMSTGSTIMAMSKIMLKMRTDTFRMETQVYPLLNPQHYYRTIQVTLPLPTHLHDAQEEILYRRRQVPC